MPSAVQAEAGVVAAGRAVPFVGHVHESVVNGDAHRLDATGIHRAPLCRADGAVGTHTDHRDLVAPGIGDEQVPAVTRRLERTLRTEDRAGACAVRCEGR